ncbi:hypothetical protein JXC34_07090 [Candidatus Woesearchaeota archaeon]|nr:hypothetical protein [Candidatus Woesearchaeota archaeon]
MRIRNLKYIVPASEIKDIIKVKSTYLRNKGIKAIIFDFDQTLSKYHGEEINNKVSKHLEKPKKDFKTCIITNTNSRRRKESSKKKTMTVI